MQPLDTTPLNRQAFALPRLANTALDLITDIAFVALEGLSQEEVRGMVENLLAISPQIASQLLSPQPSLQIQFAADNFRGKAPSPLETDALDQLRRRVSSINGAETVLPEADITATKHDLAALTLYWITLLRDEEKSLLNRKKTYRKFTEASDSLLFGIHFCHSLLITLEPALFQMQQKAFVNQRASAGGKAKGERSEALKRWALDLYHAQYRHLNAKDAGRLIARKIPPSLTTDHTGRALSQNFPRLLADVIRRHKLNER